MQGVKCVSLVCYEISYEIKGFIFIENYLYEKIYNFSFNSLDVIVVE
jgi:hypothetical protein